MKKYNQDWELLSIVIAFALIFAMQLGLWWQMLIGESK